MFDPLSKLQKLKLKKNPVSIVSNDCWGGQFYRHLQLEYTTPFVGIFFFAPCYIKLIYSLEENIKSDNIVKITNSKYKDSNIFRENKNWYYPIGLLNNEIEIHFMHFNSWEDAIDKWGKRKKRFNFQNILIKFDGSKDLADDELVEKFLKLNVKKKVLFMKSSDFSYIDGTTIFMDNWQIDGAKMYKKSLANFDIFKLINQGRVENTLINKIWNRFFVIKNKSLL